MATNNLTATTEAAEVVSNGESEVNTIFTTREEAEQHRPSSAKAEAWKVFEVTRPNGNDPLYVWAFNGMSAIYQIARTEGYSASAATRKARVNIVSMLNAYTPEQMRLLGMTDVMIHAIMAARNGSTTAAAHVQNAEPNMPPVTPPKGKGRKGN